MNKSTLLKNCTKRAMGQIQPPGREHLTQSEAGFSLLELIVVVLMIAILSAIAAPSWLAFVNRQRVAKVNDQVWSAVQEAQQQAKRTKLSYNVSFQTDSDELEVAVYPEDTDPTSIPWRPLSEGLDIKDGQVILCSNIDQTTLNKNSGSTSCNFTQQRTITFNYQGNLDGDPELGDTGFQGLAVTVAIPNDADEPIPATARCVMVKTLIGSMQIGKDEYDDTSNKQGCPL